MFQDRCIHSGCNALPTVEAHRPIPGTKYTEIRPLCDLHANAEGFCTFCGEEAAPEADDRNAAGLCAACVAEGIGEHGGQ